MYDRINDIIGNYISSMLEDSFDLENEVEHALDDMQSRIYDAIQDRIDSIITNRIEDVIYDIENGNFDDEIGDIA